MGASTVTVRLAVMMVPKLAAAPAALGTEPFQLAGLDQLPSASTFQLDGDVVVETVYIETSAVPPGPAVLLSYAPPFQGSATARFGLLNASYADCPPGAPYVLHTSNLNVLPLLSPSALSGIVMVVEVFVSVTVCA